MSTLPETPQDVIRTMTGGNAELVRAAFGAVVDSEQSLSIATDTLSTIKLRLKNIEMERKKKVDPLNALLKDWNASFKEVSQPLTDADNCLRPKVIKYQAELEAAKRKEAEEERKRREAELLSVAQQKADMGNTEGAERLLEMASSVKAKPEEVGRGGFTGAKSSLVSRWVYDLVDIKALANARPECVTVNAVAVNAAIKAGARDIPGLTIREEKTVSIRG